MLEEMIIEVVRKIIRREVISGVVAGTVAEVTNTSCTIKREGQPDITDALLNGKEGELANYITIVPKEGSQVLAAIIEGKTTEAVIIACETPEKVLWKIGTAVYEFDADGHLIKRGNETLKKILDDLFEGILALTVTTSSGPSGTPINAATFQAIKNRLPDLFKG